MKTQKISFTGYDARPLKGILARDSGFGKPFCNLLQETAEILNKEGVDVFLQTSNGIVKNNFSKIESKPTGFWPWAQDRIMFLQDKTIFASPVGAIDRGYEKIAEFFKTTFSTNKKNIDGGNYFFIKEKHGKDSVILGKDEFQLLKFPEVKKFFNNKTITSITQPDFHIDLGIRPLNNKNILVNDPQMLINELKAASTRAKVLATKESDTKLGNVADKIDNLIKQIESSSTHLDSIKNYKLLRQELKHNKFNVIKVPACIGTPDTNLSFLESLAKQNGAPSSLTQNLNYKMNYVNAIVHERPDKSLVYITGKTRLDNEIGITPQIAEKIDFSFEKMFKNSLKNYIAPEDIHFVGKGFVSDLIEKYDGGFHCLFAEIPKNNQY